MIYQPTEQNEFMIGGIESFREAAARNHFQAVTRVIHFAEDVVDEKTSKKQGFPWAATSMMCAASGIWMEKP